MEPINFPEANKVLQKPEGWTDEECVPLPVFTNGQQCISCWQPTEQERKDIADGKPVFISVFSGGTQPPIWLGTEYPFVKDEKVESRDNRFIDTGGI